MIWKDPLHTRISVLNIVKMVILLKSTYRFSEVPIEIPKHSSQKWKTYILKRNLPHDPAIQLISTVALDQWIATPLEDEQAFHRGHLRPSA